MFCLVYGVSVIKRNAGWYSAEKAPRLEIETSTFADHWQKALEQPQHADVVFLAEGRNSFKAHKVVLCSASTFFKQVLSADLNSQVRCALESTSICKFVQAFGADVFRCERYLIFSVSSLPDLLCVCTLRESFRVK